jgi:hypothetical protein
LLNAESFLARRLDMLQRALQGAGAGGPLPYVLIDNSSKCNTNDNSEKVLPNGTVWLPQLMRKVGCWAVTLPAVAVNKGLHSVSACLERMRICI